MYTFLTRNGQTLAFGLGLLVTVIAVLLIITGVDEFSAIPETDISRYDTTIFNFGMYAAVFLAIAAAAAMVLFGIYQLASDPKGAIKGIIGLGVVIAVFLIIYSIADPNPQMLEIQARDGFFVSPGQSKMITAGIATALILTVGSFIALAISEVLSFFR